MAWEWKRQVVENLTVQDLAQQETKHFNPESTNKIVTDEVKEKRQTDPEYLYTDETFSPAQSSLSYTSEYEARLPQGIVWRRPYMISQTVAFMKDGFSRDDVIQGQLGDCYLLSALTTVANRSKTIKKCVPQHQELGSSENYTGAFHFQFWQFGTWVDIVVDDWLPSIKTKRGDFTPVFGRSKSPSEFWICLMEKAYAKLHGSYEAIGSGGITKDALEDLTGGLVVKYYFQGLNGKELEAFSRRLRKAVRNRNFVSFELYGDGTYNRETGLSTHHSYSVTLAELIKVGDEKISLFRVRNPWGRKDLEWKLRWSDNDFENWNRLTGTDRKRLQYPAGEGEWYMCYEDIVKHFTSVIICTITPDFDQDGVQDTNGYYYSYAKGKWSGENSGGSFLNNSRWFSLNPQYLIKVQSLTLDQNEDGRCSVFIGLMQKYRCLQLEDRNPWSIGYRFYEVPGNLGKYLLSNQRKVPYSHFNQLKLLEACDNCMSVREISFGFDLVPEKHYLFLPCTEYTSQEEDFLIRIYSEEKIRFLELA